MAIDISTSDQPDTETQKPGEAVLTAASALSSALRTTLGPNGMDKMLINDRGTVVVTNDGSIILNRMKIESPVGRVVERVADAQADAVGDGTTMVILLTGELLQAATSLRDDGMHPTTIVNGYAKAVDYAQRQLRDFGMTIDGQATTRLTQVAETAVTGRWDHRSTARFAELTVEALQHVDFDTSRLTLKSYAGGQLRESEQINGLLIDTDTSSTSIESVGVTAGESTVAPTVAMIDNEVGIEIPDRIEAVDLQDTNQVGEFQAHEQNVREAIVGQVIESNADALICQKSIDETVRNRLFHQGVLVVERTRQDEFDAIARTTGSSPVQSVDMLTPADTGCADAIEHQTVGTTPTLTIRGTTGEPQTSLLLRGGTEHVAEEVRRIINDCIDVVRLAHQDGLLLPGGGAAAAALVDDILDYAASVPDRTQLAIEAFAEALEGVPRVLAQNAGQDPIDTITELQHRHHAGERTVGIDSDGNLQDMSEAGVVEPAVVFYTALGRAAEAASMILRIDDVIATGAPANHDKAGHAHDGHSHDEHSHGGQATGGYPWAVGH